MCGIIGIANLGNSFARKIEIQRQQASQYFLTELLVATQERGRDATGAAAIFNDGNYMGVKMGIPAAEFIVRKSTTEPDYRGFLKVWKKAINLPVHYKDARIILGHCRKTSVGNVYNNNNNHPLVIDPLMLVHNGTLKNHDIVFDNLDCDRKGTVDSEAILQLLYKYTDNGKKLFNINILLEVAKHLEGSFAVLAANANNPYQLAILRGNTTHARPIDCCLIKPLNMAIFASEKSFINIAQYKYNKMASLYNEALDLELKWPLLNKDDVSYKLIPDDTCSILDLTRVPTEKETISDLIETTKIPLHPKIWTEKKTTDVATRRRNNLYGDDPINVSTKNTPVNKPKKNASKTFTKEVVGFLYTKACEKFQPIDEDGVEVDDVGNQEFEISTQEETTSASVRDKSDNEIVKIEIEESSREINYFIDTATKESEVICVELSEDSITEQNTTNLPTKPRNTVRVLADVNTNSDAVKAAAAYAEQIEQFDTSEEVLSALQMLNSPDILKGDSGIVLVNRTLKKYAATKYFYDGFIAGLKAAELKEIDKQEKRTHLIKTAKLFIKALFKAIQEFNKNSTVDNTDVKKVGTIRDFINQSIAEQEKLPKDTIDKLFTATELQENIELQKALNTIKKQNAE